MAYHLLISAYISAAFAVAFAGTWFVARFSEQLHLIDVPNSRSSHDRLVPRGGGIAIVAATLAVSSVEFLTTSDGSDGLAVVLGAACVVATLSLIDDRYGLAPLTRGVVHFLASAWVVGALGLGAKTGLPVIDEFPALAVVACVLAVVWATNLFNFMDGIDGIAGCQSIAISLCLAAMLWQVGDETGAAFSLVIAAATVGFLYWNWPPASIFLGDVGSAFLGFVLAAISLRLIQKSATALPAVLILWSLFLVDATVTLLRRAISGERLYEAHRSHAYQILARMGASHLRVTAGWLAANAIVVAPLALTAFAYPRLGWLLAAPWLGVLVLVVVTIGAGRVDR